MRNMPYKKRKKVSAQQVALFATAYFFIPLQFKTIKIWDVSWPLTMDKSVLD